MKKPFIDFEGRTIALSGASSDIGQAIAQMLAEYDAKLLLLGRDAAALENIRNTLAGSEHAFAVIDLDDVAAIHTTLKPIFTERAPIYGVCHCAGIVHTRPLASSKPELISQQLNINLTAGLELSRLATHRALAQQGEGSIVFVSSVYSHVGAPGQIGYCASKGAINAAVRAMAVELAPRNIRVNSISPGFIPTQMTTEKSMLSAEQIQHIVNKHPLGAGRAIDIARAVTFLLDPQNRWISGTDFIIDGGYTAQ